MRYGAIIQTQRQLSRGKRHAGAISLLLMVAAWFMLTQPARALTVNDVTKDLICQCGCNKVLAVCEMTGWAIPAKELIEEKIAQGQSREEIVAYFVEEYGEKILAAPTKTGFNLTAWILPFAVIGTGGYGILRFLQAWVARWSREHQPPTAFDEEGDDPSLDTFRQQLHSDLIQLDE